MARNLCIGRLCIARPRIPKVSLLIFETRLDASRSSADPFLRSVHSHDLTDWSTQQVITVDSVLLAHPAPEMMLYTNPVPFSLFCDLVTAIAAVPPRRTDQPRTHFASEGRSKQAKLLQRWIKAVKEEHSPETGDPLPPGTVIIFMRLFFPDEGVRRR